MITEQQAGACIFIVDDEPVNLKLLDKMLAGYGFGQRVLIEDPRQVIPLYRQHQPDLILLDLNMPHLDGYQVMAALQELQDPLLPPIVILTAQHASEYLLRALASGARDFIGKPFDRSELLMRVRNQLDAQLAHRLLHDQKRLLEEMVHKRTRELRQARLQVIQKLGQAAEYRDEETGNHILRMSHICELIARAAGWSSDQCELILNASPMHDIGKIAIPDAILLKPGKLDRDEWTVMQSHARLGSQLLEGDDSELMQMARQIAHSHHEKWDGSGYPEGLAGAAIPQAARIAALADVFDALTSDRPYKQAWTSRAAVDFICTHSGRHFDPELTRIFAGELSGITEIQRRYSDPPLHH